MYDTVINIDRKKILLILNWFIDNCGKSQYYKTFPKIRVYRIYEGNSKEYDYVYKGEFIFDTQTISIYLKNCKSVKDICKTIAHEYKHYLLSKKEFIKSYKILEKGGYNEDEQYENHPHEKKCLKFQEKWGTICYNQLKNKLYKK